MNDARRILDLLPKPVALVDASLGVRDRNPAFVSTFGDAGGEPSCAARRAFWEGLGDTIARMQPASPLGRFRWASRDPDARPFDVQVSRAGQDEFLVVADDVSPYVQVETIQGSVREYVERVLNGLDHGIIVLDADLRITLFNSAQRALWERAGVSASLDLIGEPVAAVYPVFDAGQWQRVRAALARGEATRLTNVAWPEAGSRRLDVAVLPIGAAGEPVSASICVTEEFDA